MKIRVILACLSLAVCAVVQTGCHHHHHHSSSRPVYVRPDRRPVVIVPDSTLRPAYRPSRPPAVRPRPPVVVVPPSSNGRRPPVVVVPEGRPVRRPTYYREPR